MHMLRIALTILAVTIPVVVTASGRETAAPSDIVIRVRAHDGRAAALILEGVTRSEIIRRLIDRLEKSDVIVYVETQPGLKGRVAGTLTWLTKTPQFRYVRISIAPDQFGETGIALLAHELQHAVEVADNKSVVDPASLEALYRRIGKSVGVHAGGWDTEAARMRGEDVRRELASGRMARDRVADSIREFEPLEWHVMYRQARERAQ